MKEVLQPLDTIKTHASDFNCDLDGGSDGPSVSDKELLTGARIEPSLRFKSNEHRLQILFSDTVTSKLI